MILAGGSGTRLFPLSRPCHPKQFLKIAGEKSLLQQTIERFKGLVSFEDILIVTNKDYIFHVKADLKELGAEKAHIIAEPIGRNTAPAIALGMAYIRDNFSCANEECVFVTPADHMIKPELEFQKVVVLAEKTAAEKKAIVTIGIKPTHPETGYGYIHATQVPCGLGYLVESFREKPDKTTAEAYLKAGDYFWNAGMFVFTASTMEKAFAEHAPEISKLEHLPYSELVEKFTQMPNISIDYAIAEKCANLAVVPMGEVFWSDIGSFDAISELKLDKQGNSIYGNVIAKDCRNTMVLANERLIGAIGLDNVIVVDTPDALLISHKGRTQEVKHIVEQLQQEKRKEILENVTMHRPWGCYTVLSEGEGYKVKKIIVNPGSKLSLQMHYHRSEHWTVISGTGKAIIGDKEVYFKENESTFIPVATKHRLENPGQLPLVIIEVQNGKYVGEDDIVRFEDIYGR